MIDREPQIRPLRASQKEAENKHGQFGMLVGALLALAATGLVTNFAVILGGVLSVRTRFWLGAATVALLLSGLYVELIGRKWKRWLRPAKRLAIIFGGLLPLIVTGTALLVYATCGDSLFPIAST